MHILYLTDGFPYPLLSGRLRQYHFVRALAVRHEVTLYSMVPPTHPVEHAAAFDGVVRDLRWFTSDRLSNSKLRRVPERAQALVREVSDRGVAELVRHATEAHRRNPF
ncbi:MAG: hypothetical protein H0V12_01460, partial [Chloroflexi bacterium]|nr:hypothetical protein [Chloroflexota bacterium]